MASGLYAIAHIGHLRLFIGDASRIRSAWLPVLAQLDSGTYPNTTLQTVWNKEGSKRYFTFHLRKDIINDLEIIGIEQLAREAESI